MSSVATATGTLGSCSSGSGVEKPVESGGEMSCMSSAEAMRSASEKLPLIVTIFEFAYGCSFASGKNVYDAERGSSLLRWLGNGDTSSLLLGNGFLLNDLPLSKSGGERIAYPLTVSVATAAILKHKANGPAQELPPDHTMYTSSFTTAP